MTDILLRFGLGFTGGAIIGSFLATMVLRWPAGRSLDGRSACDHCGRQLSVVDLVPIASSLVSGGKCRTCGQPIDATHLQVELAAAAIGAMAIVVGQGMIGPALAVFGWMLLPLGVLDARHHWLPDRLVFLLALAGLLLGGQLGVPLSERVIGMAAGWVSLAVLRVAYRMLRGREGMGGGDPKLLGAIGAWLGWDQLPTVLLVAALIGLAAAVLHRRGVGDRIAFGTPLCAASWLVAVSLAWAPS